MKRFFVICILLAASLGFAQEMKAQFAGPIVRKDANLVDRNGNILSDEDIIGLVGSDVFEETVVGARRQLKAGKGLIIGGAAGIGIGLVFAVFTGVAMANNSAQYDRDMRDGRRDDFYTYGYAPALYFCSVAFTSLGLTALGGGIAFRAIGKGRLGWVADQCNSHKTVATLEWSATPAGAGLVMRF